MAQVFLKNDWVGPGCRWFFKSDSGTTQFIPDNLLSYLPDTAKVFADTGELIDLSPAQSETLRGFDHARASEESVAEAVEAVRVRADNMVAQRRKPAKAE